MGRIAAYLVAGIGVGLGFAYWQGIGGSDAVPASGLTVAERAPLERRLSELETSLALERFERQALADEVQALRASLAGNPADAADDRFARAGDDAGDDVRSLVEDRVWARFPEGRPQSREELEQMARQRQLERYVEAGLTTERAQWIMRREDELEMEVLQARYAATQNGASPEEVASLDMSSLLREELGDADYESYLEGRGRPTSINVREVLTNSPAQTAGLQPGDEIVSYNGKRVFDISELNEMTFESKPGETVALEVVRDGQPMQVYVEGGPIGISGGGRPSRRGGPDGFGGR